MTPLETKVLEITREICFGQENFGLDTEIEDSLDLVECVMEVEEAYDIQIDDDLSDGFRTPNDIVLYLQKVGKA